jgi:hypothetical protein
MTIFRLSVLGYEYAPGGYGNGTREYPALTVMSVCLPILLLVRGIKLPPTVDVSHGDGLNVHLQVPAVTVSTYWFE